MNPDEQTNTEDQEWDAVNQDFLGSDPTKPVVDEAKKDEAATDETAKTDEADAEATKKAEDEAAKKAAGEAEAEKAKDETPEQTKARHEQEAEEAKKNAPVEIQDNPAAREHRTIQRELAEDRKAVIADVKKELFGDVKTELTDSDGDPIRTVEDVQKLLNPNTKQPFTAEEAAAYLFAAQKHLEKTLQENDAKIENIADTNLSLKDQGDNIRVKYGELLKLMPDVRQRVWAMFEKTLVRDEKTNIILEAPVSMESFYETALRPYAQYAARLEAEANQTTQKDEAANKKKAQSDRSDVVSGGKSDTMDPEEKEWAEAAKSLYGG